MRRLWRDYSLSIVLGGLWLLLWAAQWLVEVPLNANDPAAPPALQWVAHTLENDQSEFLQLFSFVVLTSIFVHRGSAESKDGTDRIEAKLDWLLRRVGKSPSDFEQQ